jgi:hypothetical protein
MIELSSFDTSARFCQIKEQRYKKAKGGPNDIFVNFNIFHKTKGGTGNVIFKIFQNNGDLRPGSLSF